MPCVLAPSLDEAWPPWFVVSLIVYDATLPLGWASLGDRCPGCVAGCGYPQCAAGRPHAYFAISISEFELFLPLADDVISTFLITYRYQVHISGKVFELVPIPGYCVDGYTRYPGKY